MSDIYLCCESHKTRSVRNTERKRGRDENIYTRHRLIDSCFIVHQRRTAEEYLSNNFDEHRDCLEDTMMTWCLSHTSWGAPFPGHYVSWYLRRLIMGIAR